MVARAETKYLRISSLKVIPLAKLIKGEGAGEALLLLGVLNKKGAYYLRKVLNSAIANAKNKGYEEDKLFISKVAANCGPMLKRYRAASFGRATIIRKRSTHILIELDTTDKIIEGVKIKQ